MLVNRGLVSSTLDIEQEWNGERSPFETENIYEFLTVNLKCGHHISYKHQPLFSFVSIIDVKIVAATRLSGLVYI